MLCNKKIPSLPGERLQAPWSLWLSNAGGIYNEHCSQYLCLFYEGYASVQAEHQSIVLFILPHPYINLLEQFSKSGIVETCEMNLTWIYQLLTHHYWQNAILFGHFSIKFLIIFHLTMFNKRLVPCILYVRICWNG